MSAATQCLVTRRALGCGMVAAMLGGGSQAARSHDNDARSYATVASDLRRRVDPGAVPKPIVFRELVRYASLAANSHNSQPWRFELDEHVITITPDLSRRCPAVDPDDHHLWASLGCATENLVLAAAAHGFAASVRYDDAPNGSVAIVVELDDATPSSSALFEAVTSRQSTRAEYSGQSVAPEHWRLLEDAARRDGIDVHVFSEKRDLEAILEYVVAGNTAQMRDAAFMAELKHWIRFNEAAALEARDGLFAASSGNPTLPSWLGSLVFRFAFTESAENERYSRQLRTSAGVFGFVSANESTQGWIDVGRSAQRFALQATALGLKHAFINQPVEVPAVRKQLAAYMGLGARRPDLLMRFGHGPELPKSLRRPVDEIII